MCETFSFMHMHMSYHFFYHQTLWLVREISFFDPSTGWWQYEERISSELETYFKLGHKSCEILICGFLYIIDFANGQQYRKDLQSRKRKIKRDLASAPKKGVAGLS